MVPCRYNEMKDNCFKALAFLNLAIEQIRPWDESKAEFIRKYHYNQLHRVFKDAVLQAEQIESHQNNHDRTKIREMMDHQMARNGIENLPMAPPGLGMGIFPEGLPEHRQVSLSAASALSTTLVDSPESMEFQLSSRIGQNLIFGLTPESEKRLLSSLLDDSDPLDPLTPSHNLPAIARPQLPVKLGLSSYQSEQHRSRESESDKGSKSVRSRSISSTDQVNEPRDFQPHVQAEHQKSTLTSWANIAAIAHSKSDANEAFKGHFNGITSKETAISLQRRSSTSLAQTTPTEPLSEQYRVVWVTCLPSTFTSYDISAKIDQGAVMSILIEDTLNECHPGRSACIIFQHAAHAAAFVAANEAHAARVASTTAPPSPSSEQDDHPNKAITNTLYAITAPNAKILPGAVFPLDDDLQLMSPPTLARRRLKWSRSRLFYDVSLYRFKADLYRIVGKHNVELVHFYNPGEATVVFSSVRVAKTVKQTWEAWSELSSPSRRTNSNHKSSGKTGSEDVSVVLKPGKHPLDPMRGADPKVLYRGTDISFVHDFNEVPVRLVSQYGSDGRVRKCSGGKAGITDGGVEGIFSGPEVNA